MVPRRCARSWRWSRAARSARFRSDSVTGSPALRPGRDPQRGLEAPSPEEGADEEEHEGGDGEEKVIETATAYNCFFLLFF